METMVWLQSLKIGDRVQMYDTLAQQYYPGIVQQVLGKTAYVQEESTGNRRVTDSQWAFNLETGKHLSFLGDSSLILVPAS